MEMLAIVIMGMHTIDEGRVGIAVSNIYNDTTVK